MQIKLNANLSHTKLTIIFLRFVVNYEKSANNRQLRIGWF